MPSKQTNIIHRPTKHLALVLTCVFLLGVVGACDNGTTIPTGFFQARVYGVIEAPAGAPVSSVRLTVQPYRVQCENRRSYPFVVQSDGDGQYSEAITADTPEPFSCLQVEAEAPPESNLADTTFTVEPVELELREDPPFDSLRVDVVLPPAPSDKE